MNPYMFTHLSGIEEVQPTESLFVSVSFCFPTELKEICELTSIDQLVLERAFSFRTVEAKQEKVSTTLNVAQVGALWHAEENGP